NAAFFVYLRVPRQSASALQTSTPQDDNHKGHEVSRRKNVKTEENALPDEKNLHMTPEEFRRHGHTVVDWIADYYARIESLPVLSRAKPGEIRGSLPPEPPVS